MILTVPSRKFVHVFSNRVVKRCVLRVNIHLGILLQRFHIRQRHLKVPHDRVPSFIGEVLPHERVLTDTSNLVSAVKHIVTKQIILFKKLLNLHEIRVCSN